MLEDVRDWIGFAMTVFSLLYPFMQTAPRPRQRTRVSRRRLKIGVIEWTSYHREDDIQS